MGANVIQSSKYKGCLEINVHLQLLLQLSVIHLSMLRYLCSNLRTRWWRTSAWRTTCVICNPICKLSQNWLS